MLVLEFFWSKTILGPKQMLGQNKFWNQKVLAQTNFGSKRILDPKIFSPKNLGPKSFGQKKSWVQKNFWSKNVLRSKEFLVGDHP